MIRRNLLLVCAALACASMVGGCRWLRSPWGSSGSSYGSSSESLIVESGHQQGDMGYVDGYEGETFVQEGYSYDGYAHIRLESEGSDWWVMSLVNVSGATLDDLQPGVTYVTATSGVLDDDDVDVSITGCSGPTQGNYTFDTQASRVEMQVEELEPGLRRVSFRAWFPDYDTGGEELTTGQFDYRTSSVSAGI